MMEIAQPLILGGRADPAQSYGMLNSIYPFQEGGNPSEKNPFKKHCFVSKGFPTTEMFWYLNRGCRKS